MNLRALTAVPLCAASLATATAPPPVDVVWTMSGLPLEFATVTDGDPPPFPEPYRGYRRDGEPVESQLRIYGSPQVEALSVGGAAGGCGDGYWSVRWRSLNPEIAVTANVAYTSEYPLVSSDLGAAPAGTAGTFTANACVQPVFYVVNGEPNHLVDVIIETQWYTVSVDEGDGPDMPTEITIDADPAPPRPADSISCDAYTPTFDVPLQPCSESFHITIVQDRLTELSFPVDSDGYYGRATYAAVIAFQQAIGLVADGYVGISTWNALLDGDPELLVFDNDGNGRVDPYEIPYGE